MFKIVLEEKDFSVGVRIHYLERKTLGRMRRKNMKSISIQRFCFATQYENIYIYICVAVEKSVFMICNIVHLFRCLFFLTIHIVGKTAQRIRYI